MPDATPEPGAHAFVIQRTLEILRSECTGGRGGACSQLGDELTALQRCHPESKNIECQLPEIQKLAKEKQRPELAYEEGCRFGDGVSCHEVAVALKVDSSDSAKEALDLLEKACAFGFRMECVSLGELFEKGADSWPRGVGRVVAKDLPKAFDLFKRSCFAGAAVGCTSAAALLRGGQIPADETQAKKFVSLACANGDEKACSEIEACAAPKSEVK